MQTQPFLHAGQSPWQDVGEGVRRQILVHGDDLMMVRVDFAAGAVGAVHHHPHRQATYVAAGMFEATVGGERRVIGPGDSFFVPADVPHGVVSLEAGTLIDTFSPAREDFLRASA